VSLLEKDNYLFTCRDDTVQKMDATVRSQRATNHVRTDNKINVEYLYGLSRKAYYILVIDVAYSRVAREKLKSLVEAHDSPWFHRQID
jgi:hypothetical protein